MEGVVDLVHELFVIEVASADDDKVVTEVVSCLVVSEVVDRQCCEQVGITLDWLAEHVVAVSVVVRVLKSSVLVVAGTLSVVSSDLLFEQLKLCSIKSCAGDSRAKQLDSTADIALKYGHAEAGLLAAALSVEACSERLDLVVESSMRVRGSASGQQVAQHVTGAGGGKSIVTRTRPNIDADATERRLLKEYLTWQ